MDAGGRVEMEDTPETADCPEYRVVRAAVESGDGKKRKKFWGKTQNTAPKTLF